MALNVVKATSRMVLMMDWTPFNPNLHFILYFESRQENN